jgi:two-component system, NarL family, invasion response regulator UvrY
MQDPLAVLIVDDQAPFRSVARTVVSMTPGFEVTAEAESGEEAVEATARLRPDLVLMDINMGGISGIEATRQILAAQPGVCIVLLSTYNEQDLPDDARTCGAVRYVHKEDFEPGVLLDLAPA